jgi:hypothetical protein
MIATLETSLAHVGIWALVAIFLVIMLESSAFLGLLFPGEMAALIAGALSASGAFSPSLAFASVASAAIAGDIGGYACGSSKLNPREIVGGFDGLAIACGAWGCRRANHSWWLEAANPEPAPRFCWKRSRFAIKSPCWSAAELDARAFALGTGCFGSCSPAGGPNGATA